MRFDLANAGKQHPEYARVWAVIADLSPRVVYRGQYIDPRAIIRQMRHEGYDAVCVILAFDALVRDGMLRQVYLAINPKNDEVISDEASSPDEIPEFLSDFDERIGRDEADIVPFYVAQNG